MADKEDGQGKESGGAAESQPARPTQYRFSWEITGEIVLLAVVGAFFGYLFYESFGWSSGAALMPRLTVALGAPFWVVQVVRLLRRGRVSQGQPVGSSQVMDTTFRLSGDPKGDRERFLRVVVFIVSLLIGTWLLGPHITFPIGIALYLYIYARAGLIWSSVAGLAFLGVIVGLYDMLVGVSWEYGVLLQLFGINPFGYG